MNIYKEICTLIALSINMREMLQNAFNGKYIFGIDYEPRPEFGLIEFSPRAILFLYCNDDLKSKEIYALLS